MADADDSAADGDAAPSGVTRVRSGAVRRASAGQRRVLAMPRMPSACSNACASTGKADANERGCHDYSMLCLACRVPCCMVCCTPPGPVGTGPHQPGEKPLLSCPTRTERSSPISTCTSRSNVSVCAASNVGPNRQSPAAQSRIRRTLRRIGTPSGRAAAGPPAATNARLTLAAAAVRSRAPRRKRRSPCAAAHSRWPPQGEPREREAMGASRRRTCSSAPTWRAA